MRIFAAVAFVSAVFLSPVLASADETPAPAAPAATPAPAPDANAPNLDEVICRTSPAPTGSRLGGGRECRTRREWNQMQHDAQDSARQQQMMSLTGGMASH